MYYVSLYSYMYTLYPYIYIYIHTHTQFFWTLLIINLILPVKKLRLRELKWFSPQYIRI